MPRRARIALCALVLAATSGTAGGVPAARAVATSGTHSCAVLDGGGVQCWGLNRHGEVGDGTTLDRFAPSNVAGLDQPAIAVTTGGEHSCALMADHTLRCWGSNASGQIGMRTGAAGMSAVPVPVDGFGDDIVEVVAGAQHTCALLSSGIVQCLGDNSGLQLGAMGGSRFTPVTVATGGVAMRIASTGYHTCALMQDRTVACWGENGYGQLGHSPHAGAALPSTVPALAGVVALATSVGGTCAATGDGTVRCWGLVSIEHHDGRTEVDSGTPVAVARFGTVTALAMSTGHRCALADAAMWCWGSNDAGELGDGTHEVRTAPVRVQGLAGPVQALTVGEDHTCAVLATGALRCWGENWTGQLGTADRGNRALPAPVLLDYAFAPKEVVEYYDASLDHYFVTLLDEEIAALDQGLFQGWRRTGESFKAWPLAQTGAVPVCRFYIPAPYGDSHFLSASGTECDQVRLRFPVLVAESFDVMYVMLPDAATGACPSGTRPLYRVWNARADSNHRYTTSPGLRDAAVARGGIAEGYGPDAVAMCVPR